jgi:hypothetical protein
MKAISLWQPWASWIAWGLKTVETRRHGRFACLVGRRIAIHAALRFDATAMHEAEAYLKAILLQGGPLAAQAARALRECSKFLLPMGRIVATAFVSAHRQLAESDSAAALCDCSGAAFPGLKLAGLLLTDVRQVSPTSSFGRRRPGGRGIFEVEEEAEPASASPTPCRGANAQ